MVTDSYFLFVVLFIPAFTLVIIVLLLSFSRIYRHNLILRKTAKELGFKLKKNNLLILTETHGVFDGLKVRIDYRRHNSSHFHKVFTRVLVENKNNIPQMSFHSISRSSKIKVFRGIGDSHFDSRFVFNGPNDPVLKRFLRTYSKSFLFLKGSLEVTPTHIIYYEHQLIEDPDFLCHTVKVLCDFSSHYRKSLGKDKK